MSTREPRYSVVVAARALGIRPITLRKWLRQGYIRGVKKNPRVFNSGWLVPASEVERVQREQSEAGNPVRM